VIRKLASYGQAGGPGQGLSRFQIDAGATPCIPVWATGSLVSAVPAHLMGLEGTAWEYGGLLVDTGARNLFSNGEVVHPLLTPSESAELGVSPRVSLILGGGVYRADGFNPAIGFNLLPAPYALVSSYSAGELSQVNMIVSGEFIELATDATFYGAAAEEFNQAPASTVDVVNGDFNVAGNGTTWTTDTLFGPYGTYTPVLNRIVEGDLIGIGSAGSRQWYRITLVTSPTAMTIWPAYQGTTAVNQDYKILRTGYGSMSRIVYIPDDANDTIWAYYAGNRGHRGTTGDDRVGHGRIEARKLGGHVMAPIGVDGSDVPVAGSKQSANDVAYYKGFLLYGAGRAVGWSKAGFPQAFPFGPDDFPTANISVLEPSGDFVSFEFLGDQLVAIFTDGMWLVQATGIVPEFAFYRLPEPTGALISRQLDPQIGPATGPGAVTRLAYGRPTCSGRSSIFYLSAEGLMQLAGGVAVCVSEPVGNLNYFLLGQQTAGVQAVPNLSWEPGRDIVFCAPRRFTNDFLIYMVGLKSWHRLALQMTGGTILPVGITAGVFPKGGPVPRALSYGYISAESVGTIARVQTIDWEVSPGDVLNVTATAGTSGGWLWTSPIIDLSQIYANFKFGGFLVMARASRALTPPVLLTWNVWAGSSPYNLSRRQTATLDYTFGSPDSRQLLGAVQDDPYIAITLQGLRWVELAGVLVFSSETQARR